MGHQGSQTLPDKRHLSRNQFVGQASQSILITSGIAGTCKLLWSEIAKGVFLCRLIADDGPEVDARIAGRDQTVSSRVKERRMQRPYLLSRLRVLHRAQLLEAGTSRHVVPQDAADSPILRAALAAGADYLVTNGRHLLELDPYEGIEIVSMDRYLGILEEQGLL